LESPEASSLDYALLYRRLLGYVQRRINNGEFSERALARQLCVSQPQLHNVLKGVRRLQPAFADHILKHFGITPLALITDDEIAGEVACRKQGRTTAWGSVRVGSKGPVPAAPKPEESGTHAPKKGAGSASQRSTQASHSGTRSKLKPGA
jgi:transcriptional regulator with XRE-family HTH domain